MISSSSSSSWKWTDQVGTAGCMGSWQQCVPYCSQFRWKSRVRLLVKSKYSSVVQLTVDLHIEFIQKLGILISEMRTLLFRMQFYKKFFGVCLAFMLSFGTIELHCILGNKCTK
jgi:hypothetical protein